ncbi:MAG: SpoIIE family protein phosphatase [Spirochaetes bacterium]|nr:SpoIIE family protein phosphatase [Spirochaetota bacterium]
MLNKFLDKLLIRYTDYNYLITIKSRVFVLSSFLIGFIGLYISINLLITEGLGFSFLIMFFAFIGTLLAILIFQKGYYNHGVTLLIGVTLCSTIFLFISHYLAVQEFIIFDALVGLFIFLSLFFLISISIKTLIVYGILSIVSFFIILFIGYQFGLDKHSFLMIKNNTIIPSLRLDFICYVVMWVFSIFNFIIFNKQVVINRNQTDELNKINIGLEQKVKERTKDLTEEIEERKKLQKKLVDINMKMTESILYAQTIQMTILPDESEIKKYCRDFFVLFKPKDIIGGDFYWFYPIGNNFFLGIVDCTGHGVPGALMTMKVNSIMNHIMSYNDNTPEKVLSELNFHLLSQLNQKAEDKTTYVGLDISLCLFIKEEQKLFFSGSKLNIYIIKDNHLELIKGDRKSLGYGLQKNEHLYQCHELNLDNKMKIYMTTDGFVEQCGGRKGIPYGNKNFQKLLIKNNNLPMSEQKKIMEQEFYQYKGNIEQLDDLTVIGIIPY